MTNPASQIVVTDNSDETIAFGTKFADKLNNGDTVALFGDLGSGKTTFVRGLCKGLLINETVSSPSFTIVNEYSGKFAVYHFDFYRLNSVQEILEIGFEDYFRNEVICIIEWADRAISILPDHRINIYFKSTLDNHPDWRQMEIKDQR